MEDGFTNKYEFEVDYESRVVSFGEVKFHHYSTMKTIGSFLSQFGIMGHPKKANKEFTEKYGITPSNFKRCYNAIISKVWVKPVEVYVKRFAFTAIQRINPSHLDSIWKNLDTIKQLEKEGNSHLIPFTVYHGKNTQEMKKELGKAIWKKVCKNSMTRNKHIAKLKTSQLDQVVDFPSYILKKGGNSGVPMNKYGKWLLESGCYDKTPYTGRNARAIHTCRDTESMAKRLGKGFSFKWTLEKMEQKHEEYKDLIMAEKYSPTPFKHLQDFKVKEITIGEYKATLLNNALAIYNEGKEMHHCVGMYSEYVASGDYLVYAVTKGDEKTSTIGINVERSSTGQVSYVFQQQYGLCNKFVDQPEEIDLRLELMKQLKEICNE